MTEMLFDGFPTPERPAPPTGTPAQRLRARQQGAIQAGQHPLNGRKLHPGETCGTCSHRFIYRVNRAWPKCDLGPLSHGPKTDVRASWPACDQWEERP
jgi:hypothetical protein